MALRNCQIKTINAYTNGNFYIPNYQRDYAWEEQELEDFWEDLLSVLSEEEVHHTDHFFGQIVVHTDLDEGKNYIIDGQQRTITSTIFLRVLYTILDRYSSDDDAKDACADIRANNIGRNKELHPLHLVLGELDQNFFKNYIQIGTPHEAKPERQAQTRMKKAFLFFEEKIENHIKEYKNETDQVKELCAIWQAFVQKFTVLYLEETDLSEAFIIFETLNARGRDLETADLLKNYIFSKSNDAHRALEKWNSMINKLEEIDPTKFIRHYWNSYNEFTREKSLYKAITVKVNTPRKSNDLLNMIDEYSEYYYDLIHPDNPKFFDDQKLLTSLRALRTLSASSFYPIVLAMLRTNQKKQSSFSDRDILKVVQTIEVYVFRNATICKRTANKTEVFFQKIAHDIYEDKVTDVNAVCDIIREEMVSDEEFITAFETISFKNKAVIRYILTKIHQYLDKSMEINLNNSEVHIEHIMPQNRDEWKEISKEDHEEYLWRLGNLALMDGKRNSKVSNNSFKDKKAIYEISKIEPNKDVADHETWGPEEIKERQKLFAQYAQKIWKKK